MMSIRLFDRHLYSIVVFIQRSVTTDLATQMKLFNESKQYKRTFQLFNENIIKNKLSCSRSTLFMF